MTGARRLIQSMRNLLVLMIVLMCLTAGCVRQVHFTVNSEPQGAYTVLQILNPRRNLNDWVYLGNTPLVVVHQVNVYDVYMAKSVTLRVMKEGYFDQTKVWEGRSFIRECKKKGGIFWNPRLVPMRPP